MMSTDIESEIVVPRNLMMSTEISMPRRSKCSYTRDFLLSFEEMETCRRLPRGFDLSILQDFDDISSSILENHRAPGSTSGLSTSSRWDVLSTPARWDSGKNSQGLCGKHDGVSCGLNNRYSPLQDYCSSDTENGDHSRHPLKNSEYGQLLGSGAFSRAYGGTTESLAPQVQENDHYQLKKSDKPYRPPHSYKKVRDPGVECIDLIRIRCQQQHQDVEADKTQKPTLHSSKFSHWLPEGKMEVSGGSLSVNTKYANEGSNGFVTEQKFASHYSELACKPVTSTLAFATEGISEQLCDCCNPTATRGILTCEDLERSIMPEDAVMGQNVHHMGNDNPKYACADDASKCLYSLLQEAASPKVYIGSSNEIFSSELESDNVVVNVSVKEINQQVEKRQTLESIISRRCMNELQSNQAFVFVQRGPPDRLTRTVISDPGGFPFPVTNENTASNTDEYGNSGTNREGTKSANLSQQTDLEKTKQSAFHDDWTELASNPRMESAIPDSTIEILWPDEDSLIAIDDPVATQHSKPMSKMASIMQTQQEVKLSTKVGCGETIDSTGEICWPDEESLIAIDYLLIPEHSMSIRGGNLTGAHKSTSHITLDICGGNDGSTVSGVGKLPHLSGPYDTKGSGIPSHNLLSQQSDALFHHSQPSPGRPSFRPLDSHQAQKNSQTKLIHPKSNHCTPSPHHNLHTYIYPWQTTPDKPNRFHHTAKHSQLQQSPNFPFQQMEHQLPRGSPLPPPIDQMAAYTQNLNPVQNFLPNSQQSSYVGFEMPNPDPGYVAGHNGINMGANPMYHFTLGGYDQEAYNRQFGPVFSFGQ